MISNQNLLNKIDEWSIELENNNNKHIHFAFLEIFIEFEKFLMNSFIAYSLGNASEEDFTPTLRLNFLDKEHLEGLLKCDKQFIDYIKKIEEVKKYIFEENTCPFTKIFSTAEFITNFRQMQKFRNFIAHQSEESKIKYIDNLTFAPKTK